MIGVEERRFTRLSDSLAIERTPEGKRVVVSREIDASPEQVWDILVDTRYWPGWGPSVSEVEVDQPRIEEGTRGRVRTVFGIWLPFTISRLGEWSWAWRIGPIQATGHRVVPEDASCRAGLEVPLLALPYVLLCWVALRRIEALASTDATMETEPV